MVAHDDYQVGAHVQFRWYVYRSGNRPDPYSAIILSGVVDRRYEVLPCGCSVGDCGCDYDEDEEHDPSEDESCGVIYTVLVDELDPHTYSLIYNGRVYTRDSATTVRFDIDASDITGLTLTRMPVLTQLLQVKGETIDSVPTNTPTLS